MHRLHLVLSLTSLLSGVVKAGDAALMNGVGQTLTTWDCCKPACAWGTNLRKSSNVSGFVRVCDRNDNPLSQSQGDSEQSSCADRNAGNAYLCSMYSPRPQTDDFSVGFVVTEGSENCCKCFELQWMDGPARGRRMHVQSINSGGTTDNGRDFIIVTPGGGVGPNSKGCDRQFGSSWGRQWGGVTRREDCAGLPDNLQGGCYWRFNWASGDINGWPITYQQIQCPQELTDISGCSAL